VTTTTTYDGQHVRRLSVASLIYQTKSYFWGGQENFCGEGT